MYPVILFVYNKVDTTLRTLEALESNPEASQTDLYIFSDGPKDTNPDSTGYKNVRGVREVIRRPFKFRSINIIEAQANKGLANSVIGGVSNVLEKHEAAIIIEDDVLSSRHFLSFMNAQLEQYKNDERVYAIGSWNYFYPGATENFFFRVPDSIGWATYRRSWKNFEPDASKLIAGIKELGAEKEFDINSSYPYFDMLCKQYEGKVDSWAIRWYATCFLNKAFCLYPNLSITKHIGNGEDATNCKDSVDQYRQTFEVENNQPSHARVAIHESRKAVRAHDVFFRPRSSIVKRVISRITRYASGSK